MAHQPLLAVKCKRGELEALRRTDAATVGQVTPLVELLNNAKDAPKAQVLPSLLDCAVRLAMNGQTLWIDPHWLADESSLRHHPQGIFGELDQRIEDQLALVAPNVEVPTLVPVLRSTVPDAELANVRLLQEHCRRDIAVRLRKPRRSALFDMIRWLRRVAELAGVTAGEVHVIVDEEYVKDIEERVTAEDIAVIRRIRDEFLPASITLLSGCTSGGARDYTTRLSTRTDAQLWSVVAGAVGPDADVRVRYGDYGVVPPIPKQDGQARAPNPWMRYTTAGQTLCIAKRVRQGGPGEIRADARAETFTEVADMLTERPEFAGPEYSWGDHELAECRSTGNRRTGNSSDWLAMATSHHLTYLAKSVTSVE